MAGAEERARAPEVLAADPGPLARQLDVARAAGDDDEARRALGTRRDGRRWLLASTRRAALVARAEAGALAAMSGPLAEVQETGR